MFRQPAETTKEHRELSLLKKGYTCKLTAYINFSLKEL